MYSTCPVLPVCKCHHFPESFKDFTKQSLIGSLSWRHKFLVDYPLTVIKIKIKKTNEHPFDFGFAHSRFLGTGGVCSVPFVRFFGTILAHSFLMYKSCVKI